VIQYPAITTRFREVVCLECDHHMPADNMIAACTSCGSPWVDARYDYAGLDTLWLRGLHLRQQSLWRYAELLPIAEPHPDIFMGEGGTPLIRLHQYERLFGHQQIYVKDERQSPTSSFKDRQAALSVTALKRAGISEVVLASTGNAGVAYAAYCARAGIKLWLFVNSLVPNEKMREAALYGAEVIRISGTYDEAKEVAGAFAKRKQIHYDKGAKSVPGKESMKTMAFELAEQLGLTLRDDGRWQAPDWYVQAVSGGIGPLGVFKGFSELYEMGMIDRIPKLGIIQAAGCAPMVHAHNAGQPTAAPVVPKTLITVLATGAPGYSYVQLHNAIEKHGGAMVAIEDGTAFNAMRHIAARAGLSVEPATAVAFAGLEKLITSGQVQPGEIVVVNATGHTLPAESHILGNQFVVNLASEEATDDMPTDLTTALETLDERVTTVLVVDDNNNDRRLMRKLLRRYKQYRMTEAKSGAEALEMVRDKKPDLIVTDLTMPGMDGFALLETIKTDPETADIPVVVVSAKSRTPEEEALLDQYAASVWLKGDFSRRDLVEHIVAKLGDKPIGDTQTTRRTRPGVPQPIPDNMQQVVIIDSDNDAMLEKTLETSGQYTVIHTYSGRDGLKAVHENQPDLIVMDLALQDMDGATVLEKLANDTTINHIPVVLVTQSDVSPEAMARLPAHFATMIQKSSLEPGQFLSVINNVLK
jgi:threonine synthase